MSVSNLSKHKPRLLAGFLALGLGVLAGQLSVSPIALPVALATVVAVFLATTGGALSLAALSPSVVAWVPLLQLDGFNFTLADATLAAASVAAVFALILRNKRLSGGRVWRAVFYASLYGLMVTLGGVSSGGSVVSEMLTTLKRMVQFAALVPIGMLLLSYNQVPLLITSILGSSIVVSVLSVSQYLASGARTGGPLFYSNVLGLYAVIVLNLAFAFVTTRVRPRWLSSLAWIAVFSNLASLAVSGSRSATLGLLGALVWWLSRTDWPAKAKLRFSSVLVAAIIVTLVSPFGGVAMRRWNDVLGQGVQNPDVAARLEAQRISLRVFASHPIVGVGITGLPGASRRYVTGTELYVDEVHNSGSQWVQVLAESGVLGFLFFNLILYELYVAGVKARRANPSRPLVGCMGQALSASVVTVLVAGIGMHTFIVPYVSALMWLEFAGVAALGQRARQEAGGQG